ncbi:S-layer homology domain-containing protein [Anoxybacillus sp. PDR2]|uniref:S-layer homology domain-containing protein n=1 Tax=Anoxybacillus sp. PDR2 TaxID=1636720 RepID=UPI001F2A00E0|nr:S-layer homology domain-containing protein [Anoxybacillus sp. PDR2]
MAYQPKSYRKFLAGSVSAALVATAVGPVVASAASFSDVNPNDSHAANIEKLVEKGYIKGYEDGTFKPYNNVTRGQVAKIFARILKDNGFQVPADKKAFDDVPVDAKDQELVEAAAIVKAAGVMTGNEGKLNPNQTMTRQQMAKVLVEAFDLTKPADFTSKITDLDKADEWARDYIKTLEANGVTVVTEYNPKGTVTRAAFASFVVRALDASSQTTAQDIQGVQYVDQNTLEVTFNGELKDVKKEDFAIEGVEIDSVSIKAAAAEEAKTTVVVIKTKTPLEEGKSYTISYKGQTTDKTKVDVPVVTPKVESVSAINAKTLEVKFNKELTAEQQAKAIVEVKVNGTTSLFKFDGFTGNTAKLVRSNGLALEAGKYEVTIKGEGFEEKTVETTVEAVQPKTLSIVNDQLLDATAKAPVRVELKDQYGQDVKFAGSDFTVTAFNVTQGKPVTLSYDSTKGFYIDTAANNTTVNDEFKIGDEIKISLFHNASGLNTTKTLKVVSGAQLNSVEFGNVILPSGKDKLTEDLTNVKIAYTAKDQYGNSIDLSDSNVAIIPNDETIVNKNDVTFTTVGDDKKPVINIAKFGKAGNVSIAFLNKATGDVYKLNLTVNEKSGVISKVAVDSSKLKIAQGSGNYAYLNLNVTDNYGTKIEAKDYVPKASEFTFTATNSAVVSSVGFESTAGDNYGKLKVTLAPTAKKGDVANVTVTVNKTGATATFQVEVGEAALPSTIRVAEKDEHAANLLVGSQTTVKFDIFDQYGNAAQDTTGYQVKYEVTGTDKDAIALSKTEEAANDLTGATVDVTAAKAGSATLVAKLMKGTEEVAKVEVPFTVAANSSAKFTYEVASIPTLYKDGDGSDTILDASEIGDNKHAKEIKVLAKATDGSTLTVPNSSILSVTPVTSNVKVAKDAATGKWYVAGSAPLITEDATGKIRINLATDEGTKTLEQTVTISKDDIRVTELKAMDAPVASAATAKAKTELVTATYAGTFDLSTAGVYLWTVDQFGVKSDFDINNADVVSTAGFNNIRFTSDDTFVSSASDTLTVTDVNGDTIAAANSTYRLTIIENGVALDLPVRVTTELADATPTAPAGTDFVIADETSAAANDGKIVAKATGVTFSEPVKVEYKLVTKGATAPTADTAADGISANFVKSFTANAVVFSGLDLSAAANDVYVRLVDQTGNKTAWVKLG